MNRKFIELKYHTNRNVLYTQKENKNAASGVQNLKYTIREIRSNLWLARNTVSPDNATHTQI